ncbi:MAG: hypothetical protein J7L92_05010 [Dehalococcoidia bacterium]|nr:hypothetical protein [Dehalococcoidia bacterium]
MIQGYIRRKFFGGATLISKEKLLVITGTLLPNRPLSIGGLPMNFAELRINHKPDCEHCEYRGRVG